MSPASRQASRAARSPGMSPRRAGAPPVVVADAVTGSEAVLRRSTSGRTALVPDAVIATPATGTGATPAPAAVPGTGAVAAPAAQEPLLDVMARLAAVRRDQSPEWRKADADLRAEGLTPEPRWRWLSPRGRGKPGLTATLDVYRPPAGVPASPLALDETEESVAAAAAKAGVVLAAPHRPSSWGEPQSLRVHLYPADAGGVRQQSFFLHPVDGPPVLVILLKVARASTAGAAPAGQARDMAAPVPTSVSAVVSQREPDRPDRALAAYVRSVVVHEVGHMWHALASTPVFLSASLLAGSAGPDQARVFEVLQKTVGTLARINDDRDPHWAYALQNVVEVVAESFAALVQDVPLPPSMAATYVGFGGPRDRALDARLQDVLGRGRLERLATPEQALAFVRTLPPAR